MSALSSATRTRAPRVVTPSIGTSLDSLSTSSSEPGSHRSASSTNGAAPKDVEANRRLARMRSGGRCAVPVGILTVNVEPRPNSLTTPTAPPWSLTSSVTSASPMPVPSCVLPSVPFTRWKRSKTCGTSSGGIPTPVSRTESSANPSRSSSSTVTPPSSVNLKAFDRRLSTTFSHMSWSTKTAEAVARQRTSNDNPARSMAEWNELANSAVSWATSTGS